MASKRTSKKLASVASEVLHDNDASQREKSLAGSVLAQTEEDSPEHRSRRRDGSLKIHGERWPERKKLSAVE